VSIPARLNGRRDKEDFMRKRSMWIGVVAVVGTMAFGAVGVAQDRKPVSPDDYIQILQLYARYSHAIDLEWDDGTAYSSNFAEDGILKFADNEIKGRKAIKAWADKGDSPRPVRGKGWRAGHTMSNFQAIEIAPGVANVVAYFHEGERVADDIVVKTPQGWLFRRRSPQCGNDAERAADPQRPPCDSDTSSR
jgi:hypothetical protein